MSVEAANRRSARPRLGVHRDHDTYKWWALSCTSLGMLLATINSGTLIIALPDLERSLHTSLLELVWVILVYMIASTVLVLSAGRLSDQFGRKRAYIGGFLLFGVASLGAGFAGGGTELILWRILQGIGGSFLFANAAAIVTDAFPREQLGLAMGTNTMVAAIGLVIGPVLGGALVAISWHWVFWFNVPFALAGSAWAAIILHEVTGRSEDTSFDALGTITFLIGLTGLVYGISKGGLSGWDNTAVIVSLIAAAVLLPGFVLIESRVKAPMLDLTIFKNRLFSAASLAAFTNGLARLAALNRDTTYVASCAYMFIVGIGSGMFNSPNTAAMMGTVAPHRRGIAAGARVLVQNTGAVISIAFVIAVVTSSVPKNVLFAVFSGLAKHISNAQLVPFISNMHTALWCLAGVSVIGAFVAAARPPHVRSEAASRVTEDTASAKVGAAV